MKEIWKDVVDYDNLYQVSNLGRVKRLETNINKLVIRYMICLWKNINT